MSRPDEAETLAAQLRAALVDPHADPVEVAQIAGLLERHGRRDAAAHGWAHAHDVAGALEDVDFDAVVDAIADLEDDEEPEVVLDRLFDLDELCAAAAFAGHVPAALNDAVDLTARIIRGFPEAFVPVAPSASRILARTPPRPGDPAATIWRTVEATAASLAPTLSLVPAVSLADVEPERLAAASVEENVPTVGIARGDDWQVFLSISEEGPVVVAWASALPSATRDGVNLVASPAGPGTWTWGARPGRWEVALGDERVVFDLGA